jgi:hypothetical protein
MSGYQAMAGVSTTLRNLLRDRMEQPVTVTIAPPDVSVSGVTGRRVNLYLYQVTENASLKNQEIPGQGHPGAYGNPPLSLILLYLLTAYGTSDDGADADLEAQQILGDAMRVFHEYPIVTDALHEGDDPLAPQLLDTRLLDASERVKISMIPAALENLSSLWSALPQASFRRSVIYQVSVVQIESRRLRRAPLPVRERRIHTFPLETPLVEEIVREPPLAGVHAAVAQTSDTVVLRGHNFGRAGVRVRIGESLTAVASPRPDRIELAVPTTLTAGVHLVQVIRDLLLSGAPGDPPTAHRGAASNVVPLLVIPRLVGVAPSPAVAGDPVTVTVDPPVGARQEKVLLVGDRTVAAEPVLPDAPPSATVVFRLPTGAAAIPAGNYLVRVRIDGAESLLQTDPVTLQYVGPNFTVA